MTAVSRSLRYAESEVIAYRRTWRGTVITSFVNPVLFLAAMGAGLGMLVDDGTGGGLSVPYITFVASGLIAANAMQNGAGDGSFPVMAGIMWRKNFLGTITTPLGPADIVWGRLIWGIGRLLFTLLIFAVIAVLFGALELGPAVTAIFPGVLTGIAFTAVITAWTLTQKDGRSLSTLFRFAIVPLFLFSGTFFPITQLPDWLQSVAYLTPLFHGVELVRKVALPDATEIVTAMPMWIHLSYLVAMTAIGIYLSIRLLDRRIRP
jgi:lipooligosaccharide transport system permease protein